jgi:hypothetical protein
MLRKFGQVMGAGIMGGQVNDEMARGGVMWMCGALGEVRLERCGLGGFLTCVHGVQKPFVNKMDMPRPSLLFCKFVLNFLLWHSMIHDTIGRGIRLDRARTRM